MLLLQIAAPDQYFWYTLAVGVIVVLLKLLGTVYGKMDKHLDKLDKLLEVLTYDVNDLKINQAVHNKEIETLKTGHSRLEGKIG